ncbi:MAG: RhuM family protein, partial [Bacteroidota bacterium]
MWKNYFKTAFRNLRKNKLYTGINIFGLAIGLTACLLIGIYIMHELSYDSFNKNADRIVRVTMEYSNGGTVSTTATTGTKVGPQFTRTFPSIENYVRTFIRSNVVKSGDKMFDEPRILYADSAFFKIFTFPFLAGDATTALDGKIYQVDYYNLDVIISVGYRIKSKRGTQFRIWANQIIKDFLIKGYSINEKRLSQQNEQLKELQESVKILGNVLNYKMLTNYESIGLLKIISDYAYALDIL